MAQILQFPQSAIYRPLRARSGPLHTIDVRVVDMRRPREARWHLQFAMQRAAGFRCLKDFDDAAAKARSWHQFNIRRTTLLKRFLRDVELLVLQGRIVVDVDGTRVRVKPNVAA